MPLVFINICMPKQATGNNKASLKWRGLDINDKTAEDYRLLKNAIFTHLSFTKVSSMVL